MSRSCHSAIFSSAASEFARTTRASPQICSLETGLRLCGIAELPRCSPPKGSSASRTSVRCRWRISSATRSSDAATIASVERYCAWRSRSITCDVIGAVARPRRAQIFCSISGPRCVQVPTAPEIFPTAISRAAILNRSASRRFSAYQFATFRPNVIGSAWMPCVRPISGVSLNSHARFSRTSPKRSRLFRSARGFADQQGLRRIHHVIGSEAVVQPARRFRIADGFLHGDRERDHVVPYFGFDLVDARHIDCARVRAISRRLRAARCRLRRAFPWRPARLRATSGICFRRSRRGPFPGACSVRSKLLLQHESGGEIPTSIILEMCAANVRESRAKTTDRRGRAECAVKRHAACRGMRNPRGGDSASSAEMRATSGVLFCSGI